MSAPTRYRLKLTCIKEVSGVDRPAQEGALVAITKRQVIAKDDSYSADDSDADDTEKGMKVCKSCSVKMAADAKYCSNCGTVMDDDDGDSGDSSGTAPEQKRDFSTDERRRLARSGAAMSDGSYPIQNATDLEDAIRDWGRAAESKRGAVAAHIKSRAKALGLTDRLPTNGPLAEALGTAKRAPITTTENMNMDELAKYRALAEMTDAQKAHYNRLGATEQTAFLAKSAADRQSDVAKALAADEVVYTSPGGEVFRKSDDPRTVAAVKRADQAVADLAIEKAARIEAEIEKRADAEFGLLCKSTKGRAALLKAAEAIADQALRDEVIAELRSAQQTKKSLTAPVGFGGGAANTDAKATFNSKLGEFAKSVNKTPAAATVDFLKTAEGAQLYADAFPRVN